MILFGALDFMSLISIPLCIYSFYFTHFELCFFYFFIMNYVIFIYLLYHFAVSVAIVMLISLPVPTKACKQHSGFG